MKTSHYLYLIAGIAVVMMTGFAITEDPFLDNFKKTWRQYAGTYPEEKVYLQLDKPFFKPGETVWFNAFLVNSNTHKPSSISDVVYVVLKDPKGNVYARHELFVQDGTSRGDFTIEENAPGGLYSIVAHTRWMENYSEDAYFHKQIQVQKVITPRMLLKLDFEKEAYGKGDEVVASLKIKDLQNNELQGALLEATVKIGGKEIKKFTASSDEEGKVAVKFYLPEDLQTTDGILQLLVNANGQQESISRSIPIVLNKIELAFYPEGGEAIEGVPSKIAFVALNEFGKGADVTGEIVDDQRNVVTTFESFHMGMGAFVFAPIRGKRYYAKITKPQGNATRFELPEAKGSNCGLSIEKSNTNITCKIFSPNEGVVFLVGKTHNEIYYAEKLSVHKGTTTHQIDAHVFPSGIATFTLFNAEGLEEAERLVFLNCNKTLNVTIATDKKEYLPSEKVQVKIKTTDHQGKAIAAKLSLAVVDDQLISFADDKQDNILSWFLLSSELKGDIQEPSFYFDDTEPKSEQALDYLLLTHGWSRYNWKDVLKNDKAIVYVPENSSSLSGIVKNSTGPKGQTDVVLLEVGNRRRLAKVKTTVNGQFVFKNIDASIPIALMTKKPNEIEVISRGNTIINQDNAKLSYQPNTRMMSPQVWANDDTPVIVPIDIVQPDGLAAGNLDLTMTADVAQLSEVVVVGYGEQRRSSLTASVYQVSTNEISNLSNMQNAIQGRVAGVSITPNGTPGSNAAIRIRGSSSLAAWGSEPLYVIDGYPVPARINANDNPLNMVNPEDIESITVMHSPEGTAIYGAAAANGVIMITTKSKIYHGNQRLQTPKYTTVIIQPRKFTTTKDFFIPKKTGPTQERKNFSTTVYWNHAIVTDQDGMATVTFENNDAVSAFRITAEGFTANGLIGRREQVYATVLPFSVDAKMPDYMSFEDTLMLPVMVKNVTSAAVEGKLNLKLPEALRTFGDTDIRFKAEPKQTKTIYIPIVTTSTPGKYAISIDIMSGDYRDNITHAIEILPNGFPMSVSYSGKDLNRKLRFDIGEIEKGSLQGTLNIYTDVMSDLFSGADAILREPHGCFEQVSSSTYPNVLALQFMNESGQSKEHHAARALQYIGSGYKQLTAYEIKNGGFEWFGHPPAHEGLTAYGLMEFHEMKKVFPSVSEDLIARTRQWLLDRRKGDGTFKQVKGKYDEFGDASEVVTNGYICYALSETGTTDIMTEYTHSLKECWKSKDMYRMALMANTAYNLGRKEDYERLLAYYAEVAKDGFDKMKIDRSVVRSYGKSLNLETVSLWSLALMKSIRSDINLINGGVRFILSNREHGMFGSTQATILSLKTLTAYAQYTRTLRSDGDVIVTANNSVDKVHFTSTTRDKITFQNFSRSLRTGTNTIDIAFDKTKEAMPYALDIVWNSKTPASSHDCKVRLSTVLTNTAVKQNETVRLACELKNATNESLPMTMAVIGIPAGLSVQPWQLKALQEKGVFDFYEILGNKLALYYREIAPNATHSVNLDLKAEITGTYESTASCAYLYYADEFKHWVKGTHVKVY
jgi:alpha-2-macroglobulin-like protein